MIFAGVVSCGHNAGQAKQDALGKGQQFYRKGSYADAEIQFRKAIQADSGFGEAYLWLGRAEKQRGDYPGAVANLNRAASLLPSQTAPKAELVNLLLLGYLADPARPADLRQRISQLSEQLLAGAPNSFDSARIKGYLALAAPDVPKAIQYFEEANRIKANEPDVVTALVESLLLENHAPRAEEIAHAFLQVDPHCGPVYTVLYQHYMDMHRPEDAEAVLKEKTRNNPKEIQYRIELARHYARVGKTQLVAGTLNQLLADFKDSPGALLDVADFYAEHRNWPEARRIYEQGQQANPADRVTYWKRLALVDMATNDRLAAQRLLEQVLKEEPKDAEARASHAGLLMAAKDPQQQKLGSEEFQSLVRQFPANAAYHMQYADALHVAGDLDGARIQYIAVLQQQPNNLAALQTLADLSIREQRMDDALKYAQRALALDPHSARTQLVQSAALASQRKYAEARTVLNELIEENPDLREAQFQLALLDVEERHYSEAERQFLKYYEPGKEDVLALEGLVALYKAQNEIGKAILILQQDLQKSPQSPKVRSLLAEVAQQAGEYDLAVTQYEQLARDQSDSSAVALRLGLAYEKKRESARAAAEFERACKLAPQDALAYGYLGQALAELDRKPEAIAADRRSLALDGRNPWVMNNLAYLLADTGGDLNEALKLAQEAMRLQSGDVSFSDTLGWVYLKKGDSASAIHMFESACHKSPREVAFHIHLAMALLASGDRNRSRTELTAALQLPCSTEDKRSIALLLEKIASNTH